MKRKAHPKGGGGHARVVDPDLADWLSNGRLARYRIFSAAELIAFIEHTLPRIDGMLAIRVEPKSLASHVVVLWSHRKMIERLAVEVQRSRVYGSGSADEKTKLWQRARAVYDRYHEICGMLP